MDESVLASFSEVNFIEGSTFLTQQNWQEYFGSVIPNGVYSGLEPRDYIGNTSYTDGRIFISDGVVVVNGLCAKVSTILGYTDIGTVPSTARDRFICIRVYFDEQRAELVAKYDIAPAEISGSGVPVEWQNYEFLYQVQVGYFIDNESYCCERNSSFWELPILYQTKKYRSDGADITRYSQGIDLRRVQSLDRAKQFNPVFPGVRNIYANKYFIAGNDKLSIDTFSDNKAYIYFDPINVPDGATIFISPNNSARQIFFKPCWNILNQYSDVGSSSYSYNVCFHDGDSTSTDITINSNTYGWYKITFLNNLYRDYEFEEPYESFYHVLYMRYFFIDKLE